MDEFKSAEKVLYWKWRADRLWGEGSIGPGCMKIQIIKM